MSDRRIDDGTLTQHQARVAQIAVDDLQNSVGQLIFFQQASEVGDCGSSGIPIQMQSRKLEQDSGLVQRFLHRRIAVAEPVLHQMKPQHRHQRIRRTTTFTFRVMRLDQGNQAQPRHDLIHLDQETLAAGLLTFAGVLGIGEGHLFHRSSTVMFGSGGYFTKSGNLFQSFPSFDQNSSLSSKSGHCKLVILSRFENITMSLLFLSMF